MRIFNLYFIFFLSLIFFSNCNSTKGLVGEYPLNGEANNKLKEINNGTLNTPKVCKNRNGQIGTALEFNYDEITFNSPVVSSKSYTISFWLYLNAYSDENQYIISNGAQTYSSQGFSFVVTGNKYLNKYGYDKNQIIFSVADEEKSFRAGVISDEIPKKTWIHITGTWGGKDKSKNVKLFINGKRIKGTPLEKKLKFGPRNNLTIGRPSNIKKYFLNGRLDNLKIHNRALNIFEIKKQAK